MTFRQVETLPECSKNHNGYGRLRQMIYEFVNSDLKHAEILFTEHEYVNIYSAKNSINGPIKRLHLKNVVECRIIDKRLYISRKEIGE